MRCLGDGKLRAVCILFCLALISWGLAKDVPKQGPPPKKLVKQDDGHWSPYAAPEAAEGTKEQVIEKGDTLWGLAGKHLSDAHLWPQIWEANPYIKNPHWIYPGDTILINKQLVVTEERLKQEVAQQPAASEEPDSSPALNEPVITLQPRVFEVRRPGALAIFGRDLYCSGFITQQTPPMGTYIVGGETEVLKARMVEGDIIYTNKGRRQEVIPGAEYAIVRPKGTVKGGPKHKQNLGHYVAEIGKARVLVAHADSSTAEVVFACDTVMTGDMLIPFINKRSPLARASIEFDQDYAGQRYNLSGRIENSEIRFENREVVDGATTPRPRAYGQIILAKDDLRMLGEGHIVYISLGHQVGASPGDAVVVYRDPTGFGLGGLREDLDISPSYGPETLGYREDYKKAIKERAVPHLVVGELVVLHVNDTTATAKIVYTREEVQVGDKVALLR
ncbi:MAG: LysM peptidoglycan-binding domain-containing protein [Acidobacteria bacterium]|nr:LysM peptidoglycan-binding domain-containing protein [Acidobacteriota bacterium]MBI3654812.1 LysM peptidoglycan-binding domain-containing protein [Acidobacteriota bacterium]